MATQLSAGSVSVWFVCLESWWKRKADGQYEHAFSEQGASDPDWRQPPLLFLASCMANRPGCRSLPKAVSQLCASQALCLKCFSSSRPALQNGTWASPQLLLPPLQAEWMACSLLHTQHTQAASMCPCLAPPLSDANTDWVREAKTMG